MIQCFVCEDWYHVSCLNLKGPECTGNILEEDFELICSRCVGKHTFLQQFLKAYCTKPTEEETKFCIVQSSSSKSEQQPSVADYGLPCGWRNYLCRCEECNSVVAAQGLLFLLEEDEMEEEGENVENNVSSLLQDPLVERMFAERYTVARELLYEELRPFAESKSVVTEQDMNAILKRLKERIVNDSIALGNVYP